MSRFVNLELDGAGEALPTRPRVVKDAEYYRAAALAAFEGMDFEEALRHYGKMLENGPDDPRAWSGQVRALIELEDYPEASRWADHALERFPRDP